MHLECESAHKKDRRLLLIVLLSIMPKIGASGCLYIGPSLMACIAFVLSITSNSRCKLVSVDPQDNEPGFLDFTTPKSVGLWCYEAQNGNFYDITNVDLDQKFDSARALGTTASCLGFIIWIFYLFAGCMRFGPSIFQLMGFFGILTAMFQGLVFLVYKSEVCDVYSCSLDTGGRCAISAVVFWFICGLMSCAAGKKPDDDGRGGKQEDEPQDEPQEEPTGDNPDDADAQVEGVEEA
jgi:hypothetical protein